jgi:hypothetical protein
LIDIADGDALHIGLAEKAEHDAKALRPHADERDIHFVARRNVTHATQHVSRNDRKGDGGTGAPGQERSSRE